MRPLLDLLQAIMGPVNFVRDADKLLVLGIRVFWACAFLGLTTLWILRKALPSLASTILVILVVAFAAMAYFALTGAPRTRPAPSTGHPAINIATFNLRAQDIDIAADRVWDPARKVAALNMLHGLHAPIVGTQEGFEAQLDFLCSTRGPLGVPFRWVGGAAAPGNGVHDSAIIYDMTRVELLRDGTFWLSDTPGVPSKLKDSALYRTATWAIFRVKPTTLGSTGRVLLAVNTHLDHVGEHARRLQAAVVRGYIAGLLAKHADLLAGAPVFITGDFNALRRTGAWHVFTQPWTELAVRPNVTADAHTARSVAVNARAVAVGGGATAASLADEPIPGFLDAVNAPTLSSVSGWSDVTFHAFMGVGAGSPFYVAPLRAVVSAVSFFVRAAPLCINPRDLHIDWVLYRPPPPGGQADAVMPRRYHVATDAYRMPLKEGQPPQPVLPSDHFPVLVEFEWASS